MQMDFPMVGNVWRTDRIEPEGPSTTRVDSSMSWNTSGLKAPVIDMLVARMLRKYGNEYDKRVAGMIQEKARASV
jgi:hypothetical protein